MSHSLTIQEIQAQIKILPNRPPFMLDKDLAPLYSTKVKRINEAVKRNLKRFPKDFCFQLTSAEVNILRSQFAATISKMARTRPFAFTREGANMLSMVLHTDIAIDRSIQIMRAFSALETLKTSSSEMGSETMNIILRNQEKMLAESQVMTAQILNLAQNFTEMNKRINVLETQIEAVMKVRGTFNEKHWLFGKFVEVIAEEIDQNREEITKLKKQVESSPQTQIETLIKKKRKVSNKTQSK
ncbi:MAG: ORF6N domain-containing protein [Planctomycetota bacterium]